MTALIIIAVLFVALIVAIPLIERSNLRLSNEQMGKLGRWILPVIVIMVIIQLFRHYSV